MYGCRIGFRAGFLLLQSFPEAGRPELCVAASAMHEAAVDATCVSACTSMSMFVVFG